MIKGNITTLEVRHDRVIAQSDIVRSIPIFYANENGSYVITDNPAMFESKGLNEDELISFLGFGYPLGNSTLINGVYQIQAGETLEFASTGINSRTDLFFGSPLKNLNIPYAQLKHQWRTILKDVFEQISRNLKDRPIILMLSGGYDSRIVATLLKMCGKEDVICVSYGTKNNTESAIAKEVSKKLGYEFLFVEYNEKKWRDFIFSDRFDAYVTFSHRYTSLPHFQDFIAVSELRPIMPRGGVVMAGHSCDFLAGSHLTFAVKTARTLDDLLDSLCDKLYDLRAGKIPAKLRVKISEYFRQLTWLLNVKEVDKEALVALYEFFDWRERQSKFIVNSVRVYEYFSLEWSLPLWDMRIVNFWNNVGAANKLKKKLYDDVAIEIFREADLNFDVENKIVFQRRKSAKERLQYLLKNSWIFHTALKLYRTASRDGMDPVGMASATRSVIRRASKNYYQEVKARLKSNRMDKRAYGPYSYVTDYVCAKIIEDVQEPHGKQMIAQIIQ